MSKNKSKSGIAVIVILVLALLGITAYVGYTYVQKDVSGNRNTKTEYNLVIEKDDFAYQIGEKLKSNGIIKNDTVWNWWMDKHYPKFTYINGEYNMTSSMSYEEIAKKLQNPDISHKSVSVCIPEGYTVFDIADTLEKNNICKRSDFLNACKNKNDYNYDFLHSGLLLTQDYNLLQYRVNVLHLLPFHGSGVFSILFLCHRTGVHKRLP